METYGVFLHLTYLTKHDTLQVHSRCCKWQNIILFYYMDCWKDDWVDKQRRNLLITEKGEQPLGGLDEQQRDKTQTVNREAEPQRTVQGDRGLSSVLSFNIPLVI